MESLNNKNKLSENFFDRHITAIVCISSFIPGFIPVNFLLGIFNFRGKRQEIIKGVGCTFIVGFILFALAITVVDVFGGR